MARFSGSSSCTESPIATRMKNTCGNSNLTSFEWMKYRS